MTSRESERDRGGPNREVPPLHEMTEGERESERERKRARRRVREGLKHQVPSQTRDRYVHHVSGGAWMSNGQKLIRGSLAAFEVALHAREDKTVVCVSTSMAGAPPLGLP